MRDLTFSQLRLFATIARLGSFSKAGQELGRSQPGISREMIDLELEVGGKLFHRTGRGVILSSRGEQLLPQVQAVLREADLLKSDVQRSSGVMVERVSIGLVPTMAAILGVELAERVRRDHPEVQLYLVEGASRRLSEQLEAGELDLAMMFKRDRTLASTEDAVGGLPVYLVGSPSDPALQQPTIPFRHLDGGRLICPPHPGQLRLMIEDIARRMGVELTFAVETDSPVLQKELASVGHGYSVMTLGACRAEVERGQLSASRLVDPDVELILTITHAPARQDSPAVQLVTRLLKQIVRQRTHLWMRADQAASAEI